MKYDKRKFVLRRRNDDSEGDKYLYVKRIGKDVVITTPFINEAETWYWHDQINMRLKGWTKVYLKNN